MTIINLSTPLSDDKEMQRRNEVILAAIEQYTEERMNDEYGRIHTDGSRSGGQPLHSDVEQVARALAQADGIEICSDATYALSSYGHKAQAALAAMRQPAKTEAMEHVIHSSMPIDFERRYAMDNLIAQDADLIEICPDDLVKELRHIHRDGTWSAKQPGAPHPLCVKAADRIEAQAAEIERLNKSAECLAESRRLAVKDVAALEEHMRIEIGQWKVDYDCAIMDVKQLREWVTALEVLLDCAVADYCDQNGRPKHDSHWVNEARAFLEQTKW